MRSFFLNLLLLISVKAIPISIADTSSPKPGAPQPLKAEGIDNFFRLSDRIYSGAGPEGESAFAALQKLGVKTLISVDGSKPNIELAHKYGMKYVHLPHGYNGITTHVQAELIKAAQVEPGPIFVHCHHGMHRGPTAAAVICMANEGWDADQAVAWLKTARTATNYSGLFQTIRDFHAPSFDQLKNLPSSFPEVTRVPGLVGAMVAIDEQWDHLKEIRKAGYQPPQDHPDVDPANEAVILWEHLREAQRLKESIDAGDPFLAKLKAAENQGREIETLLREAKSGKTADVSVRLDKAMDSMGQSCAACHKSYRDPALEKLK